MPDLDQPPANDEFEVSVLGAGVGESVLVHIGNGEWIVVDSLINKKTGQVAALEYLATLKADAALAIRLVVATHWHDDHTRGLASILEAAPDARFALSAALKSEEFKLALGGNATTARPSRSLTELRRALEVVRSRARLSGGQPLRWARADLPLLNRQHATVTALSPSDEGVTRSFEEIARLVPQLGVVPRTAPAHGPNQLAVVLWVTFGSYHALLGADLERSSDDLMGWVAIVRSQERPKGRAAFIKVPHHGSRNADDPAVWHEMLMPTPTAAITTFTALRRPIPTPEDQATFVQRTPHVYVTKRSINKTSQRHSRSVSNMIKSAAKSLRELDPGVGHVRWRVSDRNPTGVVEVFAGAHQVTDATIAALRRDIAAQRS